MKKVALFFITICLSVSAMSQVHRDSVTIYSTTIETFVADSIADDTTYWFAIRGSDPISVKVDFTYLDNNTTTLDFFKGHLRSDSIYYNSIDGMVNVSLPVTLDKTTYTVSDEDDEQNIFELLSDYWNADYVGVHLNVPAGGTGGNVTVILDR